MLMILDGVGLLALAGTEYGTADDQTGTENDFEETSYSSAEVQRIIERQDANGWSHSQDVGFVHDNGGRMVPYADQYLTEELFGLFGKTNKFEDDAGLADGGYR